MKKVHTVTKFNQKYWLKPYIIMNTKLREKAKKKKKIEKNFFKLINNKVLGKTMENAKKHRDIIPIQDGLFRGCSRMGGNFWAPHPKICYIYPTMVSTA